MLLYHLKRSNLPVDVRSLKTLTCVAYQQKLSSSPPANLPKNPPYVAQTRTKHGYFCTRSSKICVTSRRRAPVPNSPLPALPSNKSSPLSPANHTKSTKLPLIINTDCITVKVHHVACGLIFFLRGGEGTLKSITFDEANIAYDQTLGQGGCEISSIFLGGKSISNKCYTLHF